MLDKDIISFVCLPPSYDEAQRYPVLYYMPSAGGSVYTVINQFDIAGVADRLILDGEIEPMIIVALGVDFSLGINSAEAVGTATFESEQVYTFAEGPYEDYILTEAIPYIDAHYPTLAGREARYIGGYSMGGFAALHVGLRNPSLFSKIGGHSPTLSLDTYITPEIHAWLFPDEAQQAARDPMYLAETAEVSGLRVFLDTGPADGNGEVCKALAEALAARGANATFTELPGTHGFALLLCGRQEKSKCAEAGTMRSVGGFICPAAVTVTPSPMAMASSQRTMGNAIPWAGTPNTRAGLTRCSTSRVVRERPGCCFSRNGSRNILVPGSPGGSAMCCPY